MTNIDSGHLSHGERGIALVLSLFLMMAMSVVGASLMFLSQTETYSSMNYRLMSQARYGAESGIQKSVNYLINSYTPPTTTGTDLLSNFDTTKSPVLCTGTLCPTPNGPVVLSATSNQASNYPVPAVQTAFFNTVSNPGSLPSGSTTVAYAPYATLLSMQQIKVYGGGYQTIQTWQITSDGTINAGKTATVEVTATLETAKIPSSMYTAFGTNGGCGSLTFGGSSETDSYNSQTPGFDPTKTLTAANGGLLASNGNVGTNGNLGESGNAKIHGSLSTPRVGVGACSAGNVDALTSSGHATIDAGVLPLPQAVTLPAPTAPPACAAGGPCQVPFSGDGQVLQNGQSYGDVTINNGVLTLCTPNATCTINVNSMKFTGHGTLLIAAGATVTLNVAGVGQTTPIDLTGGSTTNASMVPAKFQIQYGGTGQVSLGGNSSLSALVYMPNAPITLAGNNSFYGSMIASTINVTGNANLYYDRSLSGSYFTVGNAMLSTFSWKKY